MKKEINIEQLNLHDSVLELVEYTEKTIVATFSHGFAEKPIGEIKIEFQNCITENFYTSYGGKNLLSKVNKQNEFYKNHNLVGLTERMNDRNLVFRILLFAGIENYKYYDLYWEVECTNIVVKS